MSSIPERFWGKVLTKRRYTNVRPLPSLLNHLHLEIHSVSFLKQWQEGTDDIILLVVNLLLLFNQIKLVCAL